MKSVKLFYAPGACSLSPHIALREAGVPFSLERLDFATRTVPDGRAYGLINPKGYVPAMEFADGSVLTEGAVIVQWVADQAPATKLLPAAGTMERVRTQEWLHYIATEIHKGMNIFYNKLASEELLAGARKKVTERLDFLGKNVEGKQYLMGDTFTVADGYAFYTMRSWQHTHKGTLTPGLTAYYQRVAARPHVKAALDAEGITA